MYFNGMTPVIGGGSDAPPMGWLGAAASREPTPFRSAPTPPIPPMSLQRPVTSSMILPGKCLPAAYSKASRARASGYTSAMIGLSFPSSTSVEI